MKTKTKPKEVYLSPKTEIVFYIGEGIICESGLGEDFSWNFELPII